MPKNDRYPKSADFRYYTDGDEKIRYVESFTLGGGKALVVPEHEIDRRQASIFALGALGLAVMETAVKLEIELSEAENIRQSAIARLEVPDGVKYSSVNRTTHHSFAPGNGNPIFTVVEKADLLDEDEARLRDNLVYISAAAHGLISVTAHRLFKLAPTEDDAQPDGLRMPVVLSLCHMGGIELLPRDQVDLAEAHPV